MPPEMSRVATRRRSLAALVVSASLFLAGCLTPQQQTVLDEMNVDRQANGRVALGAHDVAVAKAQAWADKIARDGGLSHSNLADGLGGLCWRGIGENGGYGGSIASVEDGYMNSPGHRANILNTAWDVVGVGHAPGTVSGRSVVFTVQVFVDLC
ncbi:MAG TPA: CAP domain-containing protein [Acidimicrobiales bacterium]|nr:CAP domain-containing protein [Acidimicrobiales bacterium]